jgi:OmcA/MtrC family decaheme c-type cytochrome
VHNGNRLKLPANTNQVDGIFADYVHVAFPADIHNCTYCHSDDRWKTQPSRMACGSCHDNTWFGAEPVPAGYAEHDGGQQDDDASCSVCHPANPGGRFEAISEIHKTEDPAYKQTIELTLSTPANGKFYVAGESPKVNIKVIDVATGKVVDPATIKEPLVSTNVQSGEWRRGNLMVAGPRANTVPVLTTAATNVPSTASYANNDFRVRVKPANEDPRVTRTAEAVVYQLMDVASLAPGTYTVYAEVQANVSGVPGGMSWMNFQVGTATTEKMPAGNCTACHANMRMHETSRAAEFHPDVCKVCHDNLHQMTGKTNWSNSQWGFGTGPLSRKAHGVHFGNYTENPQELNSGAFAHVIFPMDVRNCTKCHSETPSWTENAGRLPCSACHDSALAVTHMALQTYDPTPVDPWSGDEVETCEICHGGEADYAPKIVHRISNPFVPIYPRAPRE